MFRTLASQLTLAISALFIIAAFVLFQWYLHSSEKFADEVEQVLHRDLAAHIVHDNPQLESGVIDTDSLVSAFHTKMLLGPEWEFYALDTKGKVLAYSAPEGVVKLNSINLKPIHDYLNGKHFPVYGDDPRTPGAQKIFSVTPITNAQSAQAQGYLYVIIGGQKRDSATALLAGSKVVKDSAFTLGLTILFGLMAMLLIITIITKPLKKLSQRSLDYVKNDFTHLNAPPNTWLNSKEIEDLETSFICAAQHINKQLNQIKNTEQLRRELLSHISHDFKTPMTGLNGYLETWLISPEDKRKPELVHLAYQNSLQINQLVDQLFELARLESGDIQFIPEPVNVVELAYDVMQRLRFQAEQQQVQLRVVADTEHGIIAYADISKLERVLVNLIDNAIRHTQASGMVKIEINDYQDKVAMSIIDNGRGIHQNELEAIFEPKYQASNTQANIANAGLGLSIVKRLLEIHKSVIHVSSKPGIGSQFTFELGKTA
ncbi:HAMP domain-containing sensor histidine kinase [Alteromonas sp. C1M14]|uniref:sensor histidine kinase n=1 Tax=Alteromonas sp. C1M14 TaxID=2841567 RepID=UPI001C0A2291|nr:HAMP domain-containing sensor histidine kinase [Alteromonas sp. C1M14]MBU2979554.1 HAMP domain-containing histidine kinase [Alteromonas sp. C1M14]